MESWVPPVATTPPETPLLPAAAWLRLRDCPAPLEEAWATAMAWPALAACGKPEAGELPGSAVF